MVNPIGSGGTHPVAAALYGKKGEPESVRTSGQHYDQVQFSSHLSETEKRIKETSGQLVQQIRTRPSRQALDALRDRRRDLSGGRPGDRRPHVADGGVLTRNGIS